MKYKVKLREIVYREYNAVDAMEVVTPDSEFITETTIPWTAMAVTTEE